MKRLAWLLLGMVCLQLASAQTARKPSGYELRALPAEERQAVQHVRKNEVTSLSAIRSKEDIAAVQRVYDIGQVYELPHFLFTIDLDHQDTIYYVNSRLFDLHYKFLLKEKIADLRDTKLETAQYDQSPNRRFVLGTISWQNTSQQWTYELWEGDTILPPLLARTHQVIANSFFEPIIFKTNSSYHEKIAAELNLPFVTQASIIGDQTYLPLNMGKTQGMVRLVEDIESLTDIQPTDILVLKQVPLSIPPVAGVITAQPSTTLSHVNVLARSWKIPNMYLKDAATELAAYEGQWISLQVGAKGYTVQVIEKPTTTQAKTYLKIPDPNLKNRKLLGLNQLTLRERSSCGSKAATLGQIVSDKNKMYRSSEFIVPDGFCIPFAAYQDFIKQPQAQTLIQEMLATPNLQTDRHVRKEALLKLQAALIELPVDPRWMTGITQKWQEQLGGHGVFVRSSSNAEDLPNFSGAGLFSSVPNVKSPDTLEMAVKKVWASVFNLEAFEARELAKIPVNKLFMGVLVQKSVSAVASGVMVTVDPFDVKRYSAIYISAKKGLGIRVVEGVAQAEQVIYVDWSKSIQVLSRSKDTTSLEINPDGGVTEVAVEPDLVVLTDDLVRRLGKVGLQLHAGFYAKPQDIEWVVDADGKIYIVQSRPYHVDY